MSDDKTDNIDISEKLKAIRERRKQRGTQLGMPNVSSPQDGLEDEDKTTAISAGDLGLDLSADDDEEKTQTLNRPIHDDEDEKTAALSMAELGLASIEDTVDEDGEKTGALDQSEIASLLAGADPDKTANLSQQEVQAVLDNPPEPLLQNAALEPRTTEKSTLVDAQQPSIEPYVAPAAVKEVPPKLVVIEGPDAGTAFLLRKDEILIGRGLDADFVVNDASTSRRHFRIVKMDGRWQLVDQGSGNGTKVNGVQADRIILVDGMRIECGATVLTWEHAASTPTGDTSDYHAVEHTLSTPHGEQPKPKKNTGKMVALAAATLVLLVGVFLAVDKFANLGIVFPAKNPKPSELGQTKEPIDQNGSQPTNEGQVTTATHNDGTQNGGNEDSAGIAKAEELMKDKKWLAAKAELTKLADSAEVSKAKAQIDGALSGWRNRLTALAALDGKNVSKGLQALRAIDEDSPAAKGNDSYIEFAKLQSLADILLDVRKLQDEGKFEEAQKRVTEALQIDPGDRDANQLKTAISIALAKDGKALENEDGTVDASVMLPDAQIKPGLDKFAAGDFMGAVDYFDGIIYERSSKRDKIKARTIVGAIQKFETEHRVAQSNLADNKLASAIEKLVFAVKYNAVVGGGYETKLASDLAKAYNQLADKRVAKGELVDAAVALRIASFYGEPGEAMAKLEAEAQTAFDKAKSQLDSDPDAAFAGFIEVVNLLPAKSELATKATAELNKLLK